MRTTIRLLALATTTLAAGLVAAAPASAGGGCHGDATTSDARGEDATTVAMQEACFQPSVLQVDPGTVVTFVNRDEGIAHNVGGQGWGHFADMNGGDAFRATFDAAGTFAYACSYHPGMTGAIVVGGGIGAADADAVTVQPWEAPDPVVVTRPVAAEGAAGSWIVVAGVAGLAIGAAAGAGLVRTRRGAAQPA